MSAFKPKLRILIADDHEMVRQGLKRVIGERPDWEVCGEAATGREAAEKARQLKPDVVVMDLSMPQINGLQALKEIHKVLPRTEVLILTMYESEQLIREVLSAGARGFLFKTDAGSLLVAAIESLSRSQPFFNSKVGNLLVRNLRQSTSGAREWEVQSGLTPREDLVLQLVGEGLTNKEIASHLGLSVKTVETHRANLMRKLNLHSVGAVIHYALRLGRERSDAEPIL